MTFYERKLYKKIKPYLDTPDIIVIQGARQTGKTSLLHIIMRDLPENDYAYLDLEYSNLLEVCDGGPENLLAYLKQGGMLKNQEKFYVLIDEIQYMSNPSSFLKLIHDHYPYLKLIVSGSSSFDIRRKFQDSLVGRTLNFDLYPLDFEEFLVFKEKPFDLHEKIDTRVLLDELTVLYREYVLYGGYPRIVLSDSIQMKEQYLQQIIDTYVRKDIRELGRIRGMDKFNKLLRVLASQSGSLLNVTELANTTQLSKQTLEDYLFILEKTYIIKLLPPFSRNIRSELFKTHKIFFFDTGLLHLLWLKMLPREIMGSVFETAVFSDLAKNLGSENINFWRTQDKKEIDFIISWRGKIIPIEVKLNAGRMNYNAINYFTSHYHPDRAFCLSLEGKLPHDEPGLIQLAPWDLWALIAKE